MTGFFIKKAFFDGWDNLISIVVLNLGYLLIMFLGVGSLSLLADTALLSVLGLLIATGLFAFYSAATTSMTWSYTHYERPGWDGFVQGIRISWRHSLLYWVLVMLDVSLLVFIIPFYLAVAKIATLLLSVVLFWVFIALSLSLLYYYPLFFAMQGDRPTKTLKKSFIIVADNLFFTLFLALHQAVTFVISILLAGLAPGIGGLQIGQSVAVKLLMLKYDWFEENPEANRKEIPWDELLWEERESVGHRSLKNMIFPWKD
jgi:hypothetical protein